MTTAIELSELSMINDVRLLDVISHNLANADTTGFKRDIAISQGFEELLAGQMGDQVSGLNGSAGQLVPSIELLVDHAAGALQHTGNPFDLAIEGDAFFELRSERGLRYSRQGAFSVDASGRLISSHGFVVNGEDGDILLSGGDITVDRDGAIHENGEYAGKFKLVAFSDLAQLVKEGRGLMRAAPSAGMRLENNSSVRQGYQEASNVQVMKEMVQMMMTLRHFETTSKVLKGYDDMVGEAISTIAEF